MSADIVWQLTAVASLATCTMAGLAVRRVLEHLDERREHRAGSR